jgi:sortase A
MSTEPRDTRRLTLRRLEAAAFCIGAALLLVYSAARLGAETARARSVDAYRGAEARALSAAQHEVQRDSGPAGALQGAEVDQSLWSPQRAVAFEQSRQSASAPPAVLRIPSLELEVPVYGDTGEINLNRGAGHIEGTAPLGSGGNTGIAAHRDGFFRKLEHINLDVDVLLDVGGREVLYRVSSVEIVEPTDVHVLADAGSPSITLVTCYPFYFLGAAPQRYIVRADAVDLRPAAAN